MPKFEFEISQDPLVVISVDTPDDLAGKYMVTIAAEDKGKLTTGTRVDFDVTIRDDRRVEIRHTPKPGDDIEIVRKLGHFLRSMIQASSEMMAEAEKGVEQKKFLNDL